MKVILTLSVVGFILSIYTFYVEKKLKKNKNYKAVCDVSDQISCTKVAKSAYSKLGGIPNSVKGMGYYALIFVLALLNYEQYALYLASAGMAMTLYLAYISYFKLKNYCLVCNGVYIVNILLLYFTLHLN